MTAREDAARAIMADCLNKDLPTPCGEIYACMCREHAERALKAILVIEDGDVEAVAEAVYAAYAVDHLPVIGAVQSWETIGPRGQMTFLHMTRAALQSYIDRKLGKCGDG